MPVFWLGKEVRCDQGVDDKILNVVRVTEITRKKASKW